MSPSSLPDATQAVKAGRAVAPDWLWPNRFAALGPDFVTPVATQPLPAPYWVARNDALAAELGLDPNWLASDEALAIFSGNQPWGAAGAACASVYSGHQFGTWAGQLGDGRALLLGEADTAAGPIEFQLKGAGRTPYSRMGDGRAVLRSSIREFLASEAMHGLGVPTSRALCLSGSDAPVRREEVETAAVLTRTAPSFIRFGHFEHFAHHGQPQALRALADYVIDTHLPACRQAEQPDAALLDTVVARTAELMAQWQAVGFCHGVMNTDNLSVLGLTLDYGPFQFLDGFNPLHVCNHSDHQGRYAYNRQPNVALWNLYALGQALLPLIGDSDVTLAALERFRTLFPQALRQRMGAKLGLPALDVATEALVLTPLLQLMARERTDYTIFWRRLSHGLPASAGHPSVRELFIDRDGFDRWAADYARALEHSGQSQTQVLALMRASNPKFVLRNHLAELAIRASRQGDHQPVQDLLQVLQTPYDEHPGHDALADFPPDWARDISISCSS